jgi:hypothetical protein
MKQTEWASQMREASFVENILPMQESEQIILSKARR